MQDPVVQYVNNLIEQDHRSIKLRLGPMLGLNHFRRAAATIAGIELMHRIRRTHAPDQKGSVQTRQASRQTQDRSRDWECGARCVIEGDFQAPNWLDLQRLHHNRLYHHSF
jgi:hypothetical protein